MSKTVKVTALVFYAVILSIALVNIIIPSTNEGFLGATLVQLLPSIVTVSIMFFLVQKITDHRSEKTAFHQAVMSLIDLYDEVESAIYILCSEWKDKGDLNLIQSERRTVTTKLRLFENYLTALKDAKSASCYHEHFKQIESQYKKCNDSAGNIGAANNNGSTDEIEKELVSLKEKVLLLRIAALLPMDL